MPILYIDLSGDQKKNVNKNFRTCTNVTNNIFILLKKQQQNIEIQNRPGLFI